MAQYQDLNSQTRDGDYFKVVIADLDPSTDYLLRFGWVFSDKEKGESPLSNVFEFRTIDAVKQEVANVVATWEGTTLKVTWDKTSTLAKGYQIYLTNSSTTRSWTQSIDASQTQQVWTLSKESNKANFGNTFRTSFTGFLKTTYLDGTTSGVAFTVPEYADAICSLSIGVDDWSVTSIDNGFTASWKINSVDYPTYKYTEVWVEDPDTLVYDKVYSGTGPATEKLYSLALHNVKIKHFSESGCSTGFSDIKQAKAFDTIEFDNTPPDPVVNPTAAWSGTDLVVSFTMPAQNIPTYVKVHLTYSGQTEYFEKTVSGIAASANTSVKISRTELIDGFGASPSSFTAGYVTDLDIYRNENTTQVLISNISSISKPNPLAGKTTTISVAGAANAYVVSSNFDSKATGIKVYQSSTENGTYTLVASSNSSPVIVYDETNAGNTVWVKAEWTSEDGNASISIAHSVEILDVGALSIIENPIKIKTNGSIFAGTLDINDEPVLTGARAVFNKRGFFLYDDNDENGLNPTTQIIGEDNGVTATFITKKAKIANWVISDTKIENTLNAAAGSYTGLSPSGTYAFWAGGGVAGGYSVNANEDAKFSVTKEGSVIARNIKVLGGEIQVGSKFKVNTQGDLEATNVKLSGEIKAASGILGTVEIGGTIDGVTYAGQLLIDASNGSKVEIGKYTSGDIKNPVNGFSGIQVTGSTGKYVQLDPLNGIIAVKGDIGGWEIKATEISKNQTKLGSDGSIQAGADGVFKVTTAGALTATDATIMGTVRANEGGFGTFKSDMTDIDKGWKIDAAKLVSTGYSTGITKVELDGETGSIKGANIFGSVLYLNNTGATTGTDYISSGGSFRLGQGRVNYNYSTNTLAVQGDIHGSDVYIGTYDDDNYTDAPDYIKGNGQIRLGNGRIVYDPGSSELSITNTKLYLNIVSNEDGTFGDSTVVQDKNGLLTTGRAFYYGGNFYPDGATSRSTAQGGRDFVVGDVWLSRKA